MKHRNWSAYYHVTKQITRPRKTLLNAMALFHTRNPSAEAKVAIDLGCGAGIDTIALLKQGWSVLAIDSQADALSTLAASCPPSYQNRLQTKMAPFESLTALPSAQLINASYSLPFLKPDDFYSVWALILTSLPPGGLFSGTFFGINDEWNRTTRTAMTFLTTQDLRQLFADFNLALFEEDEQDEPDTRGCMKHWHRYWVVAEKCSDLD